jgi:hypothetical protein
VDFAGRLSHAAQFDEVLENGVFGSNDNGKSKYGGLSTTAASAPPPVEMMAFCVGEVKEQATTKAKYGGPSLRSG